MTTKRARRKYGEDFKKQMVSLHKAGKTRAEILREYELSGSVFDRWVSRINATGSSHEKENRTPEQEELLRLRKENQRLLMENDILKQAALLFAKK